MKNDWLFLTSLVIIIIGFILQTLGIPNYYSVPPEPIVPPLNLYNYGFFIFLVGIVLLIAALGRYVSKRMSDQDFWWIIKTGPFDRPT
ncbi:hypothetical protein EU527_16630 [Candidatus Thorarchaeota archaeon]|nr:MAG: hypothetical protein EU527_16630 [Candidatus Thorarchaeota archaeon]